MWIATGCLFLVVKAHGRVFLPSMKDKKELTRVPIFSLGLCFSDLEGSENNGSHQARAIKDVSGG